MERLVQNDAVALWRLGATTDVESKEFPAPLALFPEFLDNSIDKGKAEIIHISIKKVDGKKFILYIRDYGEGIDSNGWDRFLTWVSKSSNSMTHRYGHGAKAAMCKWMPDYETAVWSIKSKRPGNIEYRSVSSPYVGSNCDKKDIRDGSFCAGTEVCIHFSFDIFQGKYTTITELRDGLIQIIRTRYSEVVLQRVKFSIGTDDDELPIDISRMHSFEFLVKKEAKLLSNHSQRLDEENDEHGWDFQLYEITEDSPLLSSDFPIYGRRSQHNGLVHLYLENRMIVVLSYPIMLKKKQHPDYNGYVGFVHFRGPDFSRLPEPTSTKINFVKNDIYTKFQEDFARFGNAKSEKKQKRVFVKGEDVQESPSSGKRKYKRKSKAETSTPEPPREKRSKEEQVLLKRKLARFKKDCKAFQEQVEDPEKFDTLHKAMEEILSNK